LEQARSSLTLKGSVVAKDTDGDNDVDQLVFTVSNALEGEAIDLTPPTDADPADGLADTGSSNVTVISYLDSTQRLDDLDWSVTPLGKDDGDNLLEPGEKFEITVDLSGADGDIVAYTTFSLEVSRRWGA
jgi:archaellin